MLVLDLVVKPKLHLEKNYMKHNPNLLDTYFYIFLQGGFVAAQITEEMIVFHVILRERETWCRPS